MAPSIFLKPVTATPHFAISSIPHGVPQSNFSRRKMTALRGFFVIMKSDLVGQIGRYCIKKSASGLKVHVFPWLAISR
jgi:hypothetical protein